MNLKCYRCGDWPCSCKDGQTVICGDCREVLPQLQPVDLLLTDPPYGIAEAAGKNKSRCKLAVAKDYGTSNWDDETCEAGVELGRALSRWQIIFGGNYYHVMPSSCWLVWDKDNGATHFSDCELAWTNLRKTVRKLRYRWNGMLKEKPEHRWHPTQKPLEVMKWSLQQAPEEVQTVIDPFMGSGTTLRACKDLGKRGIGIELDAKYCEIAANRLRQEVLF